MQTSLQGISNKAKRDRQHRFLNLYTMLDETNLLDTWRFLNREAASGIDGVSARTYEQDLAGNLNRLVERLKRGGYRARLVRRQYIPKGDGKERPLGIPVIEDKLLQTAASRILTAIYEPEFSNRSYGYRPERSVHDAVKSVTDTLQFGHYGYVVEADIEKFFDQIDHDWLLKMLTHRIRDRAFVGLIRKWLKAGILERDGSVLHPERGTPQGGSVSPVLANIYLHYVLDLWFEKVVRKQCRGKAWLCRYADDFICAFQYQGDAEWFYTALATRLGKFGLRLSAAKTRIVPFSGHRIAEKRRFDFLGFEFRWGYSQKGEPLLKRRTSRKKFRQSLANFTAWCRANRWLPLRLLNMQLNRKLRGYYNHYGIIGNYASLEEFRYRVRQILFKWLNRCSHRRRYSWAGFLDMEKEYPIIRPTITRRI